MCPELRGRMTYRTKINGIFVLIYVPFFIGLFYWKDTPLLNTILLISIGLLIYFGMDHWWTQPMCNRLRKGEPQLWFNRPIMSLFRKAIRYGVKKD